jgi:hypothetical protein
MQNKSEVPLLASDPNCAVCNSVQRSAALSMFELNASPMEIALALGVDVESVERHFRNCIPTVASPNSADAGSVSDEQLQTLLRHSLETYHACSLTGNAVGAASALSVRLRTLNELQRRVESGEERRELLLGVDAADPKTFPPELRQFVAAYVDGILNRVATEKNGVEA